jgi:hypothetical protein
MSDEKRTATNVPPKPEWSALPTPVLLWSGVEVGAMTRRCRVVLGYQWVLPAGSKDWVSAPNPVYEVLESQDAMGGERWKSEGLQGIPAAFFEWVARLPSGWVSKTV